MSTVFGLSLPYRPANSFVVIGGRCRVGWVLVLGLVSVQALCLSRAGRWPFACGCGRALPSHPLDRTALAVWHLVVLSAMFGLVEVFDVLDSGQLMNVFPGCSALRAVAFLNRIVPINLNRVSADVYGDAVLIRAAMGGLPRELCR